MLSCYCCTVKCNSFVAKTYAGALAENKEKNFITKDFGRQELFDVLWEERRFISEDNIFIN